MFYLVNFIHRLRIARSYTKNLVNYQRHTSEKWLTTKHSSLQTKHINCNIKVRFIYKDTSQLLGKSLSSRTSKSYYFSQVDSFQAINVKFQAEKHTARLLEFGSSRTNFSNATNLTLPLISSNIDHSFVVVF